MHLPLHLYRLLHLLQTTRSPCEVDERLSQAPLQQRYEAEFRLRNMRR